MARLTKEQWEAIRTRWEYDSDEPSLAVAAGRAAAKLAFVAPNKSAVSRRMEADKEAQNPWARKGNLNGVNVEAQRKADGLMEPDATNATQPTQQKGNGVAAKKEVEARVEAVDLRAAVLARHREEWRVIVALRQEALLKRPRKDPTTGAVIGGSVTEAFDAMKLTKITAEATHIQQSGERKAWGLDIVVDPDQLKNMSDEDLREIAAGRVPRGAR